MNAYSILLSNECPQGVAYAPLKEIVNIERGTRVVRNQLSETDGYPVFQNSLTPMGYHTDSNYPGNTTFIIAAGAAGEIGYSEVDFWAADDCYCLVCGDGINSRFLYHVLLNQKPSILQKVRKASIPRLGRNVVENIRVPIPPLSVQMEVTRILDTFNALTDTLEEELTLRKKQFEYCSSALFETILQDSDRYQISELCVLEKGKTPIQKAVPGPYPMVVTTSERKSSDEYQFDSSSVCIPLVSSRGHGVASLNHVYYQEGKFALGNILCALTPKDSSQLNAKYLYYYFEQTKDYTLVPLMKGGANVALRMDDIEKVRIPLPPIETQENIVSTLDIIDELCNSDKSGVCAEIEARKQQRDYYRHKLLSFDNHH